MVSSRNGAAETLRFNKRLTLPFSHAEGRCLRKLGKFGELYVARVSREDGSFKLATPCGMCQTLIRSAQVQRVYYTISNTEYGIWVPSTDQHKIIYEDRTKM